MKYENYAKIRDSKGMKDYHVSQATGIATSTFTDWKKGRSCPKQDKLIKIADALGVSYASLLNLDVQPLEVPQYHPAVQEFIDLLPKLTDEQITSLLNTARLFVSQNGGQ